jgi:hypothetical protein
MQTIRFLTLFAMILVCPIPGVAQETDSEETSTETTTSDPANLGFQIDLIEVIDDIVSLSDQFDTGVSGIDDTHQTNYLECQSYNVEIVDSADEDTTTEEGADVVESADAFTADTAEEDLADGVSDDAEEETEAVADTCTLDENWPLVRIQWSVDSSLVDVGYEWAVKMGSCSGTELMASDTDCVLLHDTAQTLSSTGNSVEIPLSKLIGTLTTEEDEANVDRRCCSSLEGLEGSVKLYFYTGFENDENSVAYDVIYFSYDYEVPGVPSGVSVKENGETLTVNWAELSDGTGRVTYSVYHSTEPFTDAADATAVDAGDDTSFDLTGLEKEVPVYIRVGAIDDFDNIGPLSEMYLATPKETLDGWELYKDQGGGEDGGFCFVATAAYGSYLHPHVQVLRNFRDEILLPTSWGAAFVAFYYREGSQWAMWIEDRAWARQVVQVALLPLIVVAFFLVGLGPLAQLAFVLAIYGLFCSLRLYLKHRYPGCRRLGPVYRS